jgi:hypothetical protein
MALPTIPLGSRQKYMGARNPTLIPNLFIPVQSANGTTDVMDPATFLTTYPRADASVTLTVTGTITNGNTPNITLTNATFPGGVISFTYTVVTADTTTTVAEGIAKLINDSGIGDQYGLRADLSGTSNPNVVQIYHNGPVGNSTVATTATPGTLTLTLSNSGVMSGGSGPVIPYQNFPFTWSGSTLNLWYGNPVNLGADLVSAMVTQGMPIV